MVTEIATKRCALCGQLLANISEIKLCGECLGNADCCIGLEKLD